MLPGFRQEHLPGLDVVDSLCQEQAVNAMETFFGIEALAQGPAAQEPLPMVAAAIVLGPVANQPPGTAHPQAVQEKRMLRPQVRGHLGVMKLDVTTRAAHADMSLDTDR